MTKSKKYYLHSKVKNFAKVKAKNREVSISYTDFENLNMKQKSYIHQLKELGYNIQYSLV